MTSADTIIDGFLDDLRATLRRPVQEALECGVPAETIAATLAEALGLTVDTVICSKTGVEFK
jgi:hypothetical protein